MNLFISTKMQFTFGTMLALILWGKAWGLVQLTDDVSDEGQSAYKIETDVATYYFQKDAGGFSSMVDAQGNDWISFNRGSGASGIYRGIPNLVHPDNVYHPGHSNCVSTIVSQSADKVTIAANSKNGAWACTWDFYATHATMTLTKRAKNYWFLYEGTPGGKFESSDDYLVLSNGSRRACGDWIGQFTLPDPEWVYFGDKKQKRVLFLVHIDADQKADQYYPMDPMTVWGFGRQFSCCDKYMDAVPNRFSIGFLEDTTTANVTDWISQIVAAEGGAMQPCKAWFKTRDSLDVFAGQTFGLRLTYESEGCGKITVSYPKKPAWISTSGDSIYGLAPITAKIETLQVLLLSAGKQALDTLDIAIRVVERPCFVTESSITAEAQKSFALKLEYHAGGKPAQLRFLEKPAWINVTGDSLWGTPLDTGTDTLVVALEVEQVLFDTLVMSIRIEPPSLTLPRSSTELSSSGPFVLVEQTSAGAFFTIHLPNSGLFELSVFDLAGCLVWKTTGNIGTEPSRIKWGAGKQAQFRIQSGPLFIQVKQGSWEIVQRIFSMP